MLGNEEDSFGAVLLLVGATWSSMVPVVQVVQASCTTGTMEDQASSRTRTGVLTGGTQETGEVADFVSAGTTVGIADEDPVGGIADEDPAAGTAVGGIADEDPAEAVGGIHTSGIRSLSYSQMVYGCVWMGFSYKEFFLTHW